MFTFCRAFVVRRTEVLFIKKYIAMIFFKIKVKQSPKNLNDKGTRNKGYSLKYKHYVHHDYNVTILNVPNTILGL